MKKIWLMGGFGNVLFQILAYNVILSKGYKKVFFVTTLTEKNIITKTIKWSIHEKLYDDLIDESQKFKVSSSYAFCAVFFGFLSKTVGKFFSFSTFYIKKNTLDNTTLAANIFGYFQEREFLSANKSELQALGEVIYVKYSLPQKYDVVVHYRKGDSGWAVLHAGYYEQVKKLLKQEDKEICIVTDSYDDASDFFAGIDNIRILNSPNAIEDFKIMISSKKLYCAPSTFSWWAAHTLNENSQVVAPQFLENELGMYVKGLCKLI